MLKSPRSMICSGSTPLGRYDFTGTVFTSSSDGLATIIFKITLPDSNHVFTTGSSDCLSVTVLTASTSAFSSAILFCRPSSVAGPFSDASVMAPFKPSFCAISLSAFLVSSTDSAILSTSPVPAPSEICDVAPLTSSRVSFKPLTRL